MKKQLLLLTVFSLFINTSVNFAANGWLQQPCGTISNLNCVYATSQNVCYVACPSDGLLKTTDGGLIWNFLSTPSGYRIQHIFFPTLNTGYIAAFYSYQFKILKTTNAGINWNIQNFTSDSINNIFFISNSTGWILKTSEPCIYKTTNGGINWFASSNGYLGENHGGDIYFINANTGFCGGYWQNFFGFASYGTTTNGGINWTSPTMSPGPFNNLFFKDGSTGWGTTSKVSPTDELLIRKTTNGGNTWIPQYNNGTANLWELFFINESTGWVSADNGKILYTSNSGQGWNIQPTGKNVGLKAIHFFDANTGWAVGNEGTILKTTSGGNPIGIKPISNKIPNEYFLSQNYPNPFNPNTTIRFDIPERTHANLTVHDAAGKEAILLVSEVLTAGSYKVNFDGTSFSSGIYFYKLITDKYIVTRKMVLVK